MVTVITGLGLAGKSTLAKGLMHMGYKQVIEYTTRPARKGEIDHVNYHFVDDATFDRMEGAGEFVETLHVEAIYGLWKYGARKNDLKDGYILVCGPIQMRQVLDSGIPCLTVLLDIEKDRIMERAINRGDDLEEISRRLMKDKPAVDEIREQVDLVLDASNTPKKNAHRIVKELLLRNRQGMTDNRSSGYEYHIGTEKVVTAQKMDQSERNLYLEGDHGLKPYLRMKERGMPHNPVNQIAWLLLQGGSCGFCKVCRENPCNITDDETCTANIANYIRECVHIEDRKKESESE